MTMLEYRLVNIVSLFGEDVGGLQLRFELNTAPNESVRGLFAFDDGKMVLYSFWYWNGQS